MSCQILCGSSRSHDASDESMCISHDGDRIEGIYGCELGLEDVAVEMNGIGYDDCLQSRGAEVISTHL